MKTYLIVILFGSALSTMGCQNESLDIQRLFPFSLQLDAFPATVARNQPATVGIAIQTPYVTSGNSYNFSWQLALPNRGTLLLDDKEVKSGQRVAIGATTSALRLDSLTYVPADAGQHQLTLRIVDAMGQRRDTTFTLSVL